MLIPTFVFRVRCLISKALGLSLRYSRTVALQKAPFDIANEFA